MQRIFSGIIILLFVVGIFFGCNKDQTEVPTEAVKTKENIRQVSDRNIVEFSQLTEKPRIKKSAQPEYPEVARENGWEARVILEAEILEDGSVGSISVKKGSGHQELDDAAIAALKKFQFSSPKLDGKPVRTRIIIPFQFKLDKSED